MVAALSGRIDYLLLTIILHSAFALQNMAAGFGALLSASFFIKAGDFHRAQKPLERALFWGADHHLIYSQLAQVLAKQQVALQRACEYAQVALSRKPNKPAYHDIYGWILALQGEELEKAQKQIKRALEHKPGDSETQFHLGVAFIKGGQIQEGKELLVGLRRSKLASLLTRNEQEMLQAILNTQHSSPGFLKRLKQLIELRKPTRLANRQSRTAAGLIALIVLALYLASSTPHMSEYIGAIIEQVHEHQGSVVRANARIYVAVIQLTILSYVSLSFLVISTGVSLASVMAPANYLPALLMSNPVSWDTYRKVHYICQHSYLKIVNALFLLYGILIIAIVFLGKLPNWRLVRFVVLFAVMISLTVDIIVKHRLRSKRAEVVVTDHYVARDSIIETLDLTYVVVLTVVLAFLSGPLTRAWLNGFVDLSLFVSSRIGLEARVFELAAMPVKAMLPGVVSFVSEVCAHLTPVALDLPVILSSFLIFGNGLLFWGIRRTLQIIAVCAAGAVTSVFYEYIVANILTPGSRRINLGMPEFTAFMLTIVISLFAFPSRSESGQLSIRRIKGIGPKNEALLNQLNIHTVDDLVAFDISKYEFSTSLGLLGKVSGSCLSIGTIRSFREKARALRIAPMDESS